MTDDFGVEVTIYEPDIPPQSRVYPYVNGAPIDPALVTLVTKLKRIDRVDVINYKKQDDYLLGDIVVAEPHSFDVSITATYEGREYRWHYESYEGRTVLSDEALRSAEVELAKSGGATIATSLILNGRVVPDKLKTAVLTARFPGIVKELRTVPGAHVEKGEVVATIEANESLKTYDLIAPRAGEVFDISAAVGEGVSGADPI